MGVYLATGIVKDIIIEKKRIRFQDMTLDKIILQLEKEVKLEYYNFNKDETTYSWKIKPEILEGNLADFLIKQFQMYQRDNEEKNDRESEIQSILGKIKKTKTGQEIIDIAETQGSYRFQIYKYITSNISVLRDNGFKEYIDVHYSLICFFMDGKIIMECYGNILRYFEQNIRLQRNDYPIADCIKVMITE